MKIDLEHMEDIAHRSYSWYGGSIEADEIHIGEGTTFGTNVDIKVRGKFQIGDHGHIGDNFHAKAESITIGDYFYHSDTKGAGMWIGGGGSDLPYAHLKIGDRCVMHSGSINLARPVTIGDDVGLSPGVDIITHGFWGSVLEGFPAEFDEVNIGNNVIVGWGSTILPGWTIKDDVVIGANSTITRSTEYGKALYAGSPARFIKIITRPNERDLEMVLMTIQKEFHELIAHYDVPEPTTHFTAKAIFCSGIVINLDDNSVSGTHSPVTDFFRDFLRKRGIRIYHPRGFGSNLKRK